MFTDVYIKSTKIEQINIVDNNESLFTDIEIKGEDDNTQYNIKNNIVLAYSGRKPDDVIKINIENYIDDEMDQKLKIFKDNKNIFYHGKIENYLVFNYRRKLEYPFPRCLFIVDEKIFSKRYKYKQEDTVKYQNKYLKYKQKYINLKKTNQTII